MYNMVGQVMFPAGVVSVRPTATTVVHEVWALDRCTRKGREYLRASRDAMLLSRMYRRLSEKHPSNKLYRQWSHEYAVKAGKARRAAMVQLVSF